jgi:hypothetical protein
VIGCFGAATPFPVTLAETAAGDDVQRLFQLARSLSPEPLAQFEAKTRDLPCSCA